MPSDGDGAPTWVSYMERHCRSCWQDCPSTVSVIFYIEIIKLGCGGWGDCSVDKMLVVEHKGLGLILRPHIKIREWWHILVIHTLQRWGQVYLWAHCPTSLTYMVSHWESLGEKEEKIAWCLSDIDSGKSTHMCTHMHIYKWKAHTW